MNVVGFMEVRQENVQLQTNSGADETQGIGLPDSPALSISMITLSTL
jgi:hypothetical protein